MNGTSQAVKEEAWAAAIPVSLTLSQDEVTAVEGPPAPLYVILPRFTYLPILVSHALDHFRHVLPPEIKDSVNKPWFESDGLPLRWHIPAGILYDIVYRGKPSPVWQITIHFRNYPSSTLLAWQGSHSLLHAFLNSLKEAAVICAGNAASVLHMSQQAQQDLWKSVELPDLATYQRIAQSLGIAPRARGDKPPGIPLRLYVQRSSGDYMSSYGSVDYTSRPSPAVTSSGASPTLGQALQQLLPDAFSHEASVLTQSSIAEGQTVPISADDAVQDSKQVQSFLQRHAVIVAGIQPTLQTPIAWLHNTLHAPDMFLYIIVLAK